MPKVLMMNFSAEGVAVNAVVRAQFKESMADEMASVKCGEFKTIIYVGVFYVGYRLARQHSQLNTEADIHLWKIDKR